MKVLLLGANSAAKIRLAQTVDIILRGKAASALVEEIKDIPLSKSEEFFRENLCENLLVSNISSCNNETELVKCINFSNAPTAEETKEKIIILLATHLLTNSHLELLIALVNCLPTFSTRGKIYLLLSEVKFFSPEHAVDLSTWGRRQGLEEKLLEEFTRQVSVTRQKLFFFRKGERGVSTEFVTSLSAEISPPAPVPTFSLVPRPTLPRSFPSVPPPTLLSTFPSVPPPTLPTTFSSSVPPTFPSVPPPTLVPTPPSFSSILPPTPPSITKPTTLSTIRRISEQEQQEKLARIVGDYVVKTQNYTKLATRLIIGEEKLDADYCERNQQTITNYLNYARVVTEQFLDASRDLSTLCREVRELCTLSETRFRDNQHLSSQIRTLRATVDCLDSSHGTLQSMSQDMHTASLVTLQDTTTLLSTAVEEIKRQQEKVRKQREDTMLQFIITTIQIVATVTAVASLVTTAHTLFCAFQTGGIKAFTCKLADIVITKTIGAGVTTALSATPLAPVVPLMPLVSSVVSSPASVDDLVETSAETSFVGVDLPLSTVVETITQTSKLPEVIPLDVSTLTKTSTKVLAPLKCGLSGYWEAITEGWKKNDEATSLAFDLAIENYGHMETLTQETALFTSTVWGPRVMNSYDSLRQRMSDCSKVGK